MHAMLRRAASPAPPGRACDVGFCVFDLGADPRETNDLAQSQPQLAASLLARFLQLRKTMMVPNGPPVGDGAVAQPAAAVGPCDKLRETGFWQPWESGA